MESHMQTKKPILLWIIVIGYAFWALLGISQVANVLTFEMPTKRYPAFLSNEIAYALSIIGFLGGLVASASIALTGFLTSRWAPNFAGFALMCTLCSFLASLESASLGRALPDAMVLIFFSYWTLSILLGFSVVLYLTRLKRREVLT